MHIHTILRDVTVVQNRKSPQMQYLLNFEQGCPGSRFYKYRCIDIRVPCDTQRQRSNSHGTRMAMNMYWPKREPGHPIQNSMETPSVEVCDFEQQQHREELCECASRCDIAIMLM